MDHVLLEEHVSPPELETVLSFMLRSGHKMTSVPKAGSRHPEFVGPVLVVRGNVFSLSYRPPHGSFTDITVAGGAHSLNSSRK